jgi:hypothetical protein
MRGIARWSVLVGLGLGTAFALLAVWRPATPADQPAWPVGTQCGTSLDRQVNQPFPLPR